MAFDIYPNPQTNPLNVAALATSAAQPFVERESVGAFPVIPSAHAMIIRVAMINPASACLPPGPPNPTVILSAGGGTPVDVPAYPSFASIYSGVGTHIGDAAVTAESNGIFRVEVILQVTGSAWQLQIHNNHGVDARQFTWVVADNAAETAQPWLEIPHALDYDTVFAPDKLLTGQTRDAVLTVTNKGTGALTVSDLPGPLGASAFEILSVPGPINPGNCGNITIRFNAPANAGGVGPHPYTVAGNDTTATSGNAAASHNRRADLSGSAGKLEVVMVLDASGSMAYLPDGSAPGVAVSDMRWGHMVGAAKQFLDLLQFFAGNLGRIGIVVFPDTTGGTIPNPHTVPSGAVLQNAIAIPADVTPIKNLLDNATLTPDAGHGNTCMGFGIGLAMGTGVGSYGQFLGGAGDLDHNLRWLVVMSDGFHNLGPPNPADFYGPVGDLTSFRGKKIKVIAVSYGDPGALNWPPDPAQMDALRSESDGEWLDAGPNDLGTSLPKSFRIAITGGLALDPTVDPGHVLTAATPEIRRAVTVLPYDTKIAFVVNWRTFGRQRVTVQILTPDCQLITPQMAEVHPDIDFHDHERYAIFTFNEAYLRNAGETGNPRDGIWTLVISAAGLSGGDTEPVEYEVITQSRLRMRLETGQQKHYAGDNVALSALLTLDGKPIRNAGVTLTLTRPGSFFNNWFSRIKVTEPEFAESTKALGGAELTRKTIKAHAIALKGLVFNSFTNADTIVMTDPSDEGVYRTTIDGTTVPGTYTCHVTAVGETEDGVSFRREQRLQLYLDVRPAPTFTLFDVTYTRALQDDRMNLVADVRVWPRDPYGNVWLVDSEINPGIALTATGGEFAGPLFDNLDGSYSQSLRYPAGTRPAIGLRVADAEIVPRFETPPFEDLAYADQVIAFRLGVEAEKGANQHTDPLAALGDATTKDAEAFLSLGGLGSITLGVRGQAVAAQGDDDITVFVRADEELRPYTVEARSPGGRWVNLGRSAGNTQSFSLVGSGLKSTEAIRIVDTGGGIRDSRFNPSATPGVSIAGVGFRRSALHPHAGVGCLDHLWAFLRCLLQRIRW